MAQGLDWFWEMLKLVLAGAVLPGRDLPKLIFYEHLSHLSRDTWLGFERALVVHNRCSFPSRKDLVKEVDSLLMAIRQCCLQDAK